MSRRRGIATASSWSRAAVVAGPLFLAIAALLVFSVAPTISGSGAPARIEEFYSDNGDSNILLIAEPLALVGMFAFLWLVGRIRTGIAHMDKNESRAVVAFGGGIAFAVLAGASLIAHTTVAGATAFSSSFQVDVDTAMLFSHFGYVAMAGAMIGAAVMAFATVGALRAMGRPALVRATYIVGVLSLIANLFVYAPLRVRAKIT
ncbi:MAG: hypothetical protein ACRDKB_04165 [Actinomycetota bacterium]